MGGKNEGVEEGVRMINTDCVVKKQVWEHVENQVWFEVSDQVSDWVNWHAKIQLWDEVLCRVLWQVLK